MKEPEINEDIRQYVDELFCYARSKTEELRKELDARLLLLEKPTTPTNKQVNTYEVGRLYGALQSQPDLYAILRRLVHYGAIAAPPPTI